MPYGDIGGIYFYFLVNFYSILFYFFGSPYLSDIKVPQLHHQSSSSSSSSHSSSSPKGYNRYRYFIWPIPPLSLDPPQKVHILFPQTHWASSRSKHQARSKQARSFITLNHHHHYHASASSWLSSVQYIALEFRPSTHPLNIPVHC